MLPLAQFQFYDKIVRNWVGAGSNPFEAVSAKFAGETVNNKINQPIVK